jgi:hypothetical protein
MCLGNVARPLIRTFSKSVCGLGVIPFTRKYQRLFMSFFEGTSHADPLSPCMDRSPLPLPVLKYLLSSFVLLSSPLFAYAFFCCCCSSRYSG